MVYPLIELIQLAARIISLLVIVRAVMSWFSPDPRNPIVSLIYRVTEPLLAPVRNIMPIMGGMDFSPIVVLVGVQVLAQVLVQLLVSMA